MKNYDETIDSVFNRIDEYNTAQKRKKKLILRGATAFCCFCLVALVGIGVRKIGRLKTEPEQTVDDALYPGIVDIVDDRNSNTASVEDAASDPSSNTEDGDNDKSGIQSSGSETNASLELNIQQTDEIPYTQRANINLGVDDFISMTPSQLNDYYGTNVFPTVPDDLKEAENTAYGIFRREKGTGEIYWDSNAIHYSDSNYSRTVSVGVDKNTVPFDFCSLFNKPESRTLIGGTQVGIAKTENREIYAEFLYNNVGFRVVSCGLSQEEFIAVIASLIK